MKNTKLYYFTNSFPYGFGETWKANELNVLVEYFDEITVVPYCYGGNKDNPKPVPSNIIVAKPLFEEYGMHTKISDTFRLFDKNFMYYFSEFFLQKVFLSKAKFNSWRTNSIITKKMLSNPLIKDIIKNGDESYLLYFFWGTHGTEFLPLLYKNKHLKTIVKFHRFDLYDYSFPQNYIPYRKALLDSISIAAPSSNDGFLHLRERFPNMKCKLIVQPLGVIYKGKVERSTDNIFRIVSCSFLKPVKRVYLIAEALKLLKIPVLWIHIGDGDLMPELRENVSMLPANIKVELPGLIATEDLMNYYFQLKIDLFLNVSTSEGVPVSIMEALSCSIPVMATDVGGTSDVVDSTVGELLGAGLTPSVLANRLLNFYNKTNEEKDMLRLNAHKRFQEKCDSVALTRKMAEELMGQNVIGR
jgi:glycosyltransferase involved in cell wall biosynthesis